MFMSTPSPVPLIDSCRNNLVGSWRKVAGIDVGRNELDDGVAGLSFVFVTVTHEFIEEIANTYPELVGNGPGPTQCSAGWFGKRYKCIRCRLCGEMFLVLVNNVHDACHGQLVTES